jgi:GH24 family phage-related lysozyme (muramidase)
MQDLIVKMLEGFEGRVRHMYLCSAGAITVGVGHNFCGNLQAAKKLPWLLKSEPSELAKPDEVDADWNAVKLSLPGKPMSYYDKRTKLFISQRTIDKLRDEDITAHLARTKMLLPEYESYPKQVQVALFDMVYNLGPGRFGEYKHLKQSLKDRDWAKAAEECYRHGVQESRNDFAKQMFESAAKGEIAA